MYVTSLKIHNLRCFKEAQLDLRYPGEPESESGALSNVNLLVGDNGTGKTTVLKAIALVTLGDLIERSGYVPYYLVRRTKQTFPAQLFAQIVKSGDETRRLSGKPNAEESRVTARIRKGDGPYDTFSHRHSSGIMELRSETIEHSRMAASCFFIVGYGATRRAEALDKFDRGASRKARRPRYQRVAGLFEDHVPLVPTGWLEDRREVKSRGAEIRGLLNALLPKEVRLAGRSKAADTLFEQRGVGVPFSALSDGFRGYIAWVSDLLYHMNDVCPRDMRLSDMTGLVMVDEVDLHLHPSWQREVIGTVARGLPKMQFVFTTHSPIVAGTLPAANIFVMHTDDDGLPTVRQPAENVYGLNADQVLLSSYFGLESTRAPGAVDQLRELQTKALHGDRDAARRVLSKLVEGFDSVLPGSKYGARRAAKKKGTNRASKKSVTKVKRKKRR